jgi:hypothetical protein
VSKLVSVVDLLVEVGAFPNQEEAAIAISKHQVRLHVADNATGEVLGLDRAANNPYDFKVLGGQRYTFFVKKGSVWEKTATVKP